MLIATKLRWIVLAFALMVPFFVMPQQTALAEDIPEGAIEITACDYHADIEGGYYYLSADLNCGADENGIIIGAEGITIDGNGFVLTSNATSCEWVTETDPQYGCCGILNEGYDNVIIKNIEITGFCTGVALHGTAANNVTSNTIADSVIHDNGLETGISLTQGIHMTYVWDSEILNNDIYNQRGVGSACGDGGNGIFMYSGGSNIVNGNNIHDNTKAGIFTKMKPEKVTISENEVAENSQGGIVLRCKLSSMFNISDNYVHDNIGTGIYVGGPGNTVEGNVVTGSKAPLIPRGDEAADNANGIRVSRDAEDTTLSSNEVSENEAADLYVKEDLFDTLVNEDNTYESYEGPEDPEMVSGKVVESGNTDVSSGSSMSIAEVIGLILGIVAVVVIGFGYTRRRKRASANRVS